MPTTEQMAISLAADAIRAERETGDDTIIAGINKIAEASSSAFHEAFMAAVRAQRAEAKGRAFLNERLEKALAAPAPARPVRDR